jgi:Transposase, Mutator family
MARFVSGERRGRRRRRSSRRRRRSSRARLRPAGRADGIEETLYYYTFPHEHWRCLRTNNPLERRLREVRRRTRAVGAFPDGKSALLLAAARLRHVAGTKWGHAALPGHEPTGESERSGMSAPARFSAPPRESRTLQPTDLRLNKCAKNSGHYHDCFSFQMVLSGKEKQFGPFARNGNRGANNFHFCYGFLSFVGAFAAS